MELNFGAKHDGHEAEKRNFIRRVSTEVALNKRTVYEVKVCFITSELKSN